jgi:hypothetical protein
MHNQNPLIQLLIDVECAYELLALVTGGRWARFAATDPDVSKGITDALNGLRTALDAALAHPMADAIRVDLLWLLGSFYWGGDGKGLVRAVSDAALSGSVFTLPGGDRVVKVTEARLLLQCPGPVAVAEAAPDAEAVSASVSVAAVPTENEEELPRAFKPRERAVLLGMVDRPQEELLTLDDIADASKQSTGTAGRAINDLIDDEFAERPGGERGGARLTIKGRRAARKIESCLRLS